MDEIETLVVVFGAIASVFIGPLMALVLVVAGIRSRRRWPYWAAGTLLSALAASVWVYWRAFWNSWSYIDRPHPIRVPEWHQLIETAALTAANVTCLALVVAAIRANRLPRAVASSTLQEAQTGD